MKFNTIRTNKIFEIEHHKLREYNGNYSSYVKQKEEIRKAELKDYNLKAKEIKRLEGIIAQQKQWNREKNIKTAESKQKVIDRIEETMVKPEKTLDTLAFKFNLAEECANDVLTGENLSKGFGDNLLFANVNVDIKKGEKIEKTDVAVLRTEKILTPGIGPEFLEKVIGSHLAKDVKNGSGVQFEDFM